VIQSDEVKALQRFPALQARILAQMDTSLDDYRKKSRDFAINLVKMEGSLVIPQLFKVAEEQFGSDKRDMGPDAEWGQVRWWRRRRFFQYLRLELASGQKRREPRALR
jgi:hypothetical protein